MINRSWLSRVMDVHDALGNESSDNSFIHESERIGTPSKDDSGSSQNTSLRRSGRTPRPRSSYYAELEQEPQRKKRKPVLKATPSPASTPIDNDISSTKVEDQESEKYSKVTGKLKKKTGPKPKPTSKTKSVQDITQDKSKDSASDSKEELSIKTIPTATIKAGVKHASLIKPKKDSKSKKESNHDSNLKPVVKATPTSKSTTTKKKASVTPDPMQVVRTSTGNVVIPTIDVAEWSSNMALEFSYYRNDSSILSRLKSPNFKPVPYAGLVMKVMSFINKFSYYFASELGGLSFQDFEVGLDLYPGGFNNKSNAIVRDSEPKKIPYQDFLTTKEIKKCQNHMNLLFLTLLRLTFTNDMEVKKQPQAFINDLRDKHIFAPLINELREKSEEWGYPKEWTMKDTFENVISIHRDGNSDNNTLVNYALTETKTPQENISLDKSRTSGRDILLEADIDIHGILALEPNDRIIMMSATVDWCMTYSPLIHNDIHKLSHSKRDPAFGVRTQHAPRYLLDGEDETMRRFVRLCDFIQRRYEIRGQKKHLKKLLKAGMKNDFKDKYDTLMDIKHCVNGITSEQEKIDTYTELYDKWTKIFEGEVDEHPLSDPYNDETYKLRSHEFFIGRIPHMGDFYLPRLHCYDDEKISLINYHTDMRTFREVLNSFKEKKYDASTLFDNYGQTMSSRFKVLYHDTPALVHDFNKGTITNDKIYWYELCHDTESLKQFIELLGFKILPPKMKKEDPDKQQEKEQKKSKTWVPKIINDQPLPKEAKYNITREKLKLMRDYLQDLSWILEEYEELRETFQDMVPGKRQSRRNMKATETYSSTSEYEQDSEDE